MCRYMWLLIAFRDNQQISLADSTVKGLLFSRVFTLYLYYTICISKREYERLSKLLRITKWMSKLPHVWVSCSTADCGYTM